jgi:glycosyltransferase involved in cell wall biosynthesis
MKEQMKIIHLIENIDDRYGGPAKSVPELCHHLNNLNIESEILSIKLFQNENNELITKYDLKWISFKYEIIKKLRISLTLNQYLNKEIKLTSNLIINIHNQWNYIPYLALQLKRKYNFKLVSTIRGSIKLDKLHKKIVWILFQKTMLNNCDLIHVTKKSDITDLRELGIKSKIAYVPNGINLEEFTNLPTKKLAKENLELDSNKKYILFLGRIHKAKGLAYLVNSWIKIAHQYTNWDLLIVGPIYDKQYKDKIISNIISHNLLRRVHFKGMLKGNKKIEALSASSLFVLPSFSENFGMSIAEAMAAKLPVITTHGTPWQEITQYDSGWWIELTDENINSSLKEALNCNDEELKQKGLNGFNLIKQYKWEFQAKKMKEIYDFILFNKNKPVFIYETGD